MLVDKPDGLFGSNKVDIELVGSFPYYLFLSSY